MTRWPLDCESCGTKVYRGTLAGGECSECHRRTIVAQLEGRDTSQAGLGEFV